MDDPTIAHDACCQSAWLAMQHAWNLHGNSAPFWDTYQHLLTQHCATDRQPQACANQIARMAQRLGAVEQAMMV
jgi:hypothetical protein